jgi:amino acid transporter
MSSTPEGTALVAVDRSGDLREKGLAGNALTLKDSVIIGLASTAPAYSLAATIGYVVLEVGEFTPAAILVAFIPMLFTAFAYRELNRAVPDCGTTFTWGAKAFGPWVGWIGGWAVALAGTIFLANAAEVAAYYFYSALASMGVGPAEGLADNPAAVTSLGALSIALMTYVSYRGIEISARMQNVLVYFQYGVLVLFSLALGYTIVTQGLPEGGVSPSASMFNPLNIESSSALIAAVVLCVFLFWGWESTLAVNEETENPDKTPGRAAIISTVLLLITYLMVSTGVVSFGGTGEGLLDFSEEAVADGSADDVFTPLAGAVGLWLIILIQLAIVVSALSSSQTTIMPTTRGMLSMGAYKALPESFARVHPYYKSPGFSTAVMGISAIVYYVGMSFISQNLLYDSIYSIGLAITFYYALTGYSSVWYFRHDLRVSVRDFATKGLMPLIGALALTYVFVLSARDMMDPENNFTSIGNVGAAFVLGIGGLALGAVIMVLLAVRSEQRPYFRGETLTVDTPVLVPEGEHAVVITHEVPAGAEVDVDEVENVLDVLEEELEAEHEAERRDDEGR